MWSDFWSGGLANPLQVIEQITYLIFIKRLDEMQKPEERKATTLGKPIERPTPPRQKSPRAGDWMLKAKTPGAHYGKLPPRD